MKSLLKNIGELIELIDQGAHFDKEHFEALKDNAIKELQSIHQINEMNT